MSKGSARGVRRQQEGGKDESRDARDLSTHVRCFLPSSEAVGESEGGQLSRRVLCGAATTTTTAEGRGEGEGEGGVREYTAIGVQLTLLGTGGSHFCSQVVMRCEVCALDGDDAASEREGARGGEETSELLVHT